jgi:integrase
VRTADDYEYYLERFFVFKCPLADVSHADICRKLGRIKKQSLYNHALAAVRGFFNWCQKKKRYITDNPVTGIDPYKRPKRKRVLTDQELRAVWLACENPDSEMPEHFRTIVKLQVLLGQRRSETAALQRAYYSHNQQAICLPAEVVKNGVEHTFPVGDMGAEVLRPLLSAEGLLFLARGKSNRPFSGWSKAKKQLDIESGVADWTLHDLRRTFRTGLSRLGVAPHISERLVNHVTAQTEVERTYDLYKFFPEMQDAMTKWQSHVAAIIKQDIATAA